MTSRLAVFFGAPAILVFIAAQIFQIEILVWISIGLFTIAAAFFAFDQM